MTHINGLNVTPVAVRCDLLSLKRKSSHSHCIFQPFSRAFLNSVLFFGEIGWKMTSLQLDGELHGYQEVVQTFDQ
jgi:hypothetical protein